MDGSATTDAECSCHKDGLRPAVGLPIALFLVLLNGFFVAAEFAIVRVRGARLAVLAGRGSATARQAQLVLLSVVFRRTSAS